MNYYIHIPFCRSKCKYCHFASFSGIEDVLVERYLGFLKREIRDFGNKGLISNPPSLPSFSKLERSTSFEKGDEVPNDKPYNRSPVPQTGPGLKDSGSIYFGGGTPSILRIDELKGILNEFNFISSPVLGGFNFISSPVLGEARRGHIDNTISPLTPPNSGGGIREITLEANPEFITREYVKGLREIGINRISLGIQTLKEESLEEIGRCTQKSIFEALDILEEMRFPNVAVDFIIGLPHVLKGETKADIEMLLCRYKSIKHVSVYMLEVGKYPENWKMISLGEDELGDEYVEIAGFLQEKGFSRYELSNFAKEGYECQHNSGYWNHSEYAGFGLSASSFIGNRRFTNASNFIGYYTGIIDNAEELTSEDLETENLMFSWRTAGIDCSRIINPIKLKEFLDEELVILHEEKIRPTDKGVAITDYIFKELFL